MISVLIYEDNDKLRDLLALLIGSTDGFRVLGTYLNARDVVRQVRESKPDVVIMDIDMPEFDGIVGVGQVKTHFPGVKVLMHTVFDDDERLFNCLSNGADGYVLKKDSPVQLLQAVHEVLEGGAPMSPGIARRVLLSFHQRKPGHAEDYHISARETQILELLSKGYSYRMIAEEYSISVETVRRHLKNIYEKLHVQSGTEAVAKALRERIIKM